MNPVIEASVLPCEVSPQVEAGVGLGGREEGPMNLACLVADLVLDRLESSVLNGVMQTMSKQNQVLLDRINGSLEQAILKITVLQKGQPSPPGSTWEAYPGHSPETPGRHTPGGTRDSTSSNGLDTHSQNTPSEASVEVLDVTRLIMEA